MLIYPHPQELQRLHPGMLVQKRISFSDVLSGKLVSEGVCTTSHRWLHADHPDRDGLQLKAIKAHIAKNPRLRLVWYDHWCMPQGEKTEAERSDFTSMLVPKRGLEWTFSHVRSCPIFRLALTSYDRPVRTEKRQHAVPWHERSDSARLVVSVPILDANGMLAGHAGHNVGWTRERRGHGVRAPHHHMYVQRGRQYC